MGILKIGNGANKSHNPTLQVKDLEHLMDTLEVFKLDKNSCYGKVFNKSTRECIICDVSDFCDSEYRRSKAKATTKILKDMTVVELERALPKSEVMRIAKYHTGKDYRKELRRALSKQRIANKKKALYAKMELKRASEEKPQVETHRDKAMEILKRRKDRASEEKPKIQTARDKAIEILERRKSKGGV
jgi:hypothetical protein